MRKPILVLLFALLGVLSAQAYDFEVDGIYYNIISGTDEVEVTSSGSSDDKYSGSVDIPATVTYEGMTYAVTSIRRGVFINCTGLTTVTLPNSVISIEDYTFQNCTGLTTVTIPNSVTSIGAQAFRGCSGLTTVTIPNSVTSIGAYVFYGCSGLTSVTIPESVDAIGFYAFRGCTSISSPVYNSKIFAYLPPNYSGEYTIPSGIQVIAESAFMDCKGLTSVTIPNSVTSIGEAAFSNCSSLISVVIPEGVTSIGTSTFSGCSCLASVTIPESVTSIGERAFMACTRLTSVTIPESVTTIGYLAFCRCTSISSPLYNSKIFAYMPEDYNGEYAIPLGIQSIAGSAFYECSELTSVTIPNSVTSIGYMAFYGCSSLTSVTIPESVTSIENYAFDGCRSLTTMTIPNSVTSIGEAAFSNCRSLTSVTIPNSVTSIGPSAFSGCGGLTSVTSLAETPPTCVLSVFSVYDTLFVPRGCKAAYESATEWENFSVIQELYMVTAQADNAAMGTVSGGGSYAFGAEATLEAVPNPVYHFVKWSDGNTDNPRTLTVTQDTTFTAEFAINTFTVSVSANNTAWGSVSPSGTDTYDSASSVTITATPNEGYRFIHWTKDEAVFSTQADTTFMVTEALTLVANFEKIPDEPVVEVTTFTVSVSANKPEWGSTSQSGNGTYDSASSVTITATPNEGYHFVCWDDGNTYNPRILTVSGDITLTAVFAVRNYTVTVQPNDTTMGSVTGSGTYKEGEQATLAAVPNKGYHFMRWDDGNTDNPRTLTVTEDTTLTALFVEDGDDPNLYTVTVQPNNANRGSVSGGGEYMYGEHATLKALPNEGFHFVRWDDGNTDNPRTLTVTKDITITAIFVKDEDETVYYTVTVRPNDATMGSVTGGGKFEEGKRATLAAIPNKGYYFDRWDDGNTDNPRTLTVTKDITITAIFAKDADPTANENSEADNFHVYVQDHTIYLSEYRGLVQVYNMAGQCVYNGHATAISVRQSGVYILVANNKRIKVLVK